MLFYVNFEVSDFERSARFYDAFLGELNIGRILERDGEFIAWSPTVHDTSFCITPKKASETLNGNGYMVALDLATPKAVDKLFARGLELGASVETPVAKGEHDFYAGILRDPDGHKIRLFCITA